MDWQFWITIFAMGTALAILITGIYSYGRERERYGDMKVRASHSHAVEMTSWRLALALQQKKIAEERRWIIISLMVIGVNIIDLFLHYK